jgi:hypothetical protein
LHWARVHPPSDDDHEIAAASPMDDDRLVCNLCAFKTEKPFVFSCHIKTHHPGCRKCKRCNKVVERSAFAIHLKRYHGVTLKKSGNVQVRARTSFPILPS